MTIIVNEIQIRDHDLRKSYWFCASDRRITLQGDYHDTRRKLYKVPYLNAAVSYFGLATITASGGKYAYLNDWLDRFIKRHVGRVTTLQEFAETMKAQLEGSINKQLLKQHVSGFHICGYNEANLPVLWFLRNARTFLPTGHYADLEDHYILTEDFLSRDAQKPEGIAYNGIDPTSCKEGKGFIYQNGDIRIAQPVWFAINDLILPFLRERGYNLPNLALPQNYSDFLKFKCEFIASLHKWTEAKNIARPIDALFLSPPES